MKYTINHYLRLGAVALLLSTAATTASAQQIRTSYFMEQSTMRIALNPAFRPDRGYVSIPGLGAINIASGSNGVALGDLLYPRGGKLVTFLDPSVDSDSFLKKLNKNNQLNVDVSASLLSAGWYAGCGFWTVDLNVKTTLNAALPKSIFEFLKLGSTANGATYNISDVAMYANAYAELATGYSLPINDKLTVGGKFKLLFGGANIAATFDNLTAELYEEQWKITSSGELQMSLGGIQPEYKKDNEGKDYINSFDVASPGLGGFGAAIDFGATYQLFDNLMLSAAVTDLGFISWGGSNTVTGQADGDFMYDGFELDINDDGSVPSMDEQMDNLTDNISNLFHFRETESKGRSTMLRSTINIGAEYSILENQLGFGLLSSTKFYQPKAYTELTASANYRPLDWFSASASYSFIHSDFKTFGLALNFSPSWINFFIGTDYMFTRVTPQFMPINAPAVNAYFGLSIPLARK